MMMEEKRIKRSIKINHHEKFLQVIKKAADVRGIYQ